MNDDELHVWKDDQWVKLGEVKGVEFDSIRPYAHLNIKMPALQQVVEGQATFRDPGDECTCDRCT